MTRLILLALLCMATPQTQAGELHGIVRSTDNCPQENVIKRNVMPGVIVRAKWAGGIKAAESDSRGRYSIVFPDGAEKLVVTFTMDGYSTIVQEVIVRGRKRIRLNYDFKSGGCPSNKSTEKLMIDPRSSITRTLVTRQQAESFGRW